MHIENLKKGAKEMPLMETCTFHSELAQIYIIRKTKLQINFQLHDTQ